MNERMNELAIQAGGVWRGGYVEHPNGDSVYTDKKYVSGGDMDVEQFAQLIVKECARVARATPAPNFHEHLKQQLGHTWDMSAVEAGREIVKHFGVEE